ncbi:acetyl-CoA synthetase-like protein [Sparassis crispa]|uniref:Acetyl-CoA synthetase-like protein n=1 Tax=Sparassis crispa TaxID=139825 RepID=A0A401GQR4_9APHY|nr:acetyl-CoA synthetase-like protein [Sparassis crispa]GBE84591.1 acetyl-CoA synthetase-like protein [Sparassis crispa]
MSQSSFLPPLDGSISVVPGCLDFQVEHNPDHPCFIFPDPECASVSFKDFAHATHRVAHILRPNHAGPDRAVVALIIHCDTLLYEAVMVGLIRASLVPFPMSPRNSAAAIVKMLKGTDCHRIVHHAPFISLTDAVRAALPETYNLQFDVLPNLSDIFPSFASPSAGLFSSPEPYSTCTDTPISRPHEPVLYLHSSGSTGFPKPIPQSQLSVLHWASAPYSVETRARGLRWASPALPPFHTMGVCMQLYAPLASGQPVALYTPRSHLNLPPPVPTTQNVLDVVRRTKSSSIVPVPSFLEEWAQNEEDVKLLASLEVVCFAGGPLSNHNGDKLIAAGVKLFAAYGGTEFGPTTRFLDTIEDSPNHPDTVKTGKTRNEWSWMAFPSEYNLRWVPQGDGSYELIFMTCATHQPSIENMSGGERGYATGDIWEPHPTKPGLWRITGRADDLIVLGNGEKFVPVAQEGHIMAHPKVMGAMIFGRGRTQAGIIVEPRGFAVSPGDEDALSKFRNVVWSQVEEANHAAPPFAKIFKETIIFTDPDRPFPRAAKGTVQRKQALTLYEAEIEQLYKTIEDSSDAHGIVPPSHWTVPVVQAWMVEHVSQLSGGIAPTPTTDLFEHGFDSLSATFLRNRIIGALRSSHEPAANAAALHVHSNFVFNHPSLVELSAAVVALVHPSHDNASTSTADESAADIEALIAKYTAVLPEPTPAGAKRERGKVVLITGTTGALGAHILALVLANPALQHVYALNRGIGVAERQRAAFEAALLPVKLLSDSKLTLLEGNIMREDLGLESAMLDEVRSSVTDIVHNAWRVDFNLSLSSFQGHIAASVRLATFVPGARFFFTSSITVAQSWKALKSSRVPEEPLGDPAVAVGIGYGSSKFVVEEVLENARKVGFPTTSLRIGQICGSADTGAWNTSEWVPSLVKSSISLGCLPRMPGVVDWIPMDSVAQATVDVVLSVSAPAVVNLVHPRPVEASSVFDNLNEELGLQLPFVPLSDWVQKLENAAQNASAKDLEIMPAIKLLEFFRSLAAGQASKASSLGADDPVFDTSKAQSASATMARLGALGKAEVHAWVKFWKGQNFLT